MNRQMKRCRVRSIDKQLAQLKKMKDFWMNFRKHVKDQKDIDNARLALQQIADEALYLFNVRRKLKETTKLKVRPSGAQEDIPLYPMGEQIS